MASNDDGRPRIGGKPYDFGHVEIRIDGVPYRTTDEPFEPDGMDFEIIPDGVDPDELTIIRLLGTPREPYTATGTFTLDPDGMRRLAEAIARMPDPPLDPSYAAAVYAVDQLTLAGAGPADAWHVARWLVGQHGADVTRVLSYTLDLWWGVTGIQA